MEQNSQKQAQMQPETKNINQNSSKLIQDSKKQFSILNKIILFEFAYKHPAAFLVLCTFLAIFIRFSIMLGWMFIVLIFTGFPLLFLFNLFLFFELYSFKTLRLSKWYYKIIQNLYLYSVSQFFAFMLLPDADDGSGYSIIDAMKFRFNIEPPKFLLDMDNYFGLLSLFFVILMIIFYIKLQKSIIKARREVRPQNK